MKEELIKIETAKLAKKKGFDARNLEINGVKYENSFALVTQSLLQTWLRKIYKINIIIQPSFSCYNIQILQYDVEEDLNKEIDMEGLNFKDFTTYEQALESALEKSLHLIK